MKTTTQLSNPDLWQRLCTFQLNDDPTATLQFSGKLLKEQKWTVEFAQRAIAEYKKFLYLCVVQPQGASPSAIVDEVWHLHLTFTVSYWQKLCGEVLQQQLHHYPNKGGASENLRHQTWYDDTLVAYVREFGELPPVDIWPLPKGLDLDAHLADDSPFKKPTFVFTSPIASVRFWGIGAAVLAVVSLIGFGLSGPQYLLLYALLIGWAWWGGSLQIATKKEIMLQATEAVHPLQFAALWKDTDTVFRIMVADLAEKGLIAYLQSDTFWYDKKTSRPLFYNLQAQETEHLNTQQVRQLLYPYAQVIDKIITPLKNTLSQHTTLFAVFNWWVLAVGIGRVFQGIFNDRPVLFLMLEIIIFGVIWAVIANTSLDTPRLRRSYETSTWHQQVALGALSLALVGGDYRFAHGSSLNTVFGPPRKTSDGGSGDSGAAAGCGSSGGDGGGGGCGGGCGGCGGS